MRTHPHHEGREREMSKDGQHLGELMADQTAAAIQAARWTAQDLLDSGELLFSMKRFQHAVSLLTLSIEEAGKVPILFAIFLGEVSPKEGWQAYRQHRAKTSMLNSGIRARIRAAF